MTQPTSVLVAYDQLDRSRGALRHARPGEHPILLVESEGMLRSRTWHAQRLHLVLSAAAHLARELEGDGFTVDRMRAESTADGVRAYRAEHPDQRIVAAEPSSHGLMRTWLDAGVDLLPDDRFLTSREDFAQWAQGRKTLRMDTFYRWQRQRLGILMDGSDPEGGAWSFDAENRLPPPKGPHPWPEPLHFPADDLDEQVWDDIVTRSLPVIGARPHGVWATTRAGALEQLHHFIERALPEFGPYEDAMPLDTWTVNHSLLSPYLNLGLLHPDEVVAAVLERHSEGDVPIASTEGFIRQIIGWREYVNGMYWFLPDDYRHRNGLQAERPLPRALAESDGTAMECVRSVVSDVHERGWVHHIPRLMVLANLSLIAGIEPKAVLDWMRRMFVDAADWVMVPNVIGMGVAADDGLMMTKPYAAGGAYLSRMGRYCKGCRFDPKKRTGEDACPFTTLYWDFIDRHREEFGSNPRMAQQVRGLDRLSDLEGVRERSLEVLTLLESGDL
jgi:deoxyribodipyrimidine photolyase-related protein